MIRALVMMTLLIAVAGCSSRTEILEPHPVLPPPDQEHLDAADVQMVVATETEMRERLARQERQQRELGTALMNGEPVLATPRPPPKRIAVAIELGYDRDHYRRCYARFRDLAFLLRERSSREAHHQFRQSHFESLQRARAEASDLSERERIADVIVEVERGLARDRALDARIDELRAELALVAPHRDLVLNTDL